MFMKPLLADTEQHVRIDTRRERGRLCTHYVRRMFWYLKQYQFIIQAVSEAQAQVIHERRGSWQPNRLRCYAGNPNRVIRRYQENTMEEHPSSDFISRNHFYRYGEATQPEMRIRRTIKDRTSILAFLGDHRNVMWRLIVSGDK
ncbi:hypothetical protein C0J52_24907 [Blattella germanica]|nr:hypothetical protein C0J52_24907 [Blattella germanica]